MSYAIKARLCEIDDNYVAQWVSGDDERGNKRQGKPKGGYAILWHKSVSHRVTELPCKIEESVALLSKWMMEERFYLCVATCQLII